MTPTSVIVLSQANLYREAWKALLSVQPGIEVVGAVATPEALADLVPPEGGGCVLVDIDPVCRMAVERENGISAEWNGDTYYFCSRGCRAEFAHTQKPKPDGMRMRDSRP